MAPQWDNLIIDSGAVPVQLDETQFREWTASHRFFVSSTMDAEMTPFRDAARRWLSSIGSPPIMWEEIVPRDERADIAYLDGVNRSDGFILLLGSRYGVSDVTGYSPTHKEGERAKARGIPRLVFDLSELRDGPRDGRLVDWLRSLQAEVSIARFSNEQELLGQLEQRLREVASYQETPWLKLGPIVVPGTVDQHSRGGDTEFTVRIRTRDPATQRILSELDTFRSDVTVDRLTWGSATFPVTIESVVGATVSTSVREFNITCRHALGRGDSPMNYESNGIGPGQKVEIWSRRALFGEDRVDPLLRRVEYDTAPDFEPLPQLLQRVRARGWIAEGLSRLYFIEAISAKFEGEIERLEVGPVTTSSVRIKSQFQVTTHERDTVPIEGLVPLAS
jgi:hypothetical protein